MNSITVIKNSKGDFETHVTGCSDIKRSGRHSFYGEQPNVYTGETLVAAIREADTDMADWFCQEVYDPSPAENPWTITATHFAPCFAKLVKAERITFASPTGEPSVQR